MGTITTWCVPHKQVVYKRYASLYFVCGIDGGDNELITLEVIHHFVEVLDRYFGNVCELDLIFNFHKARARLPHAVQTAGARRGRPHSLLAVTTSCNKTIHVLSVLRQG